MKSFSEIVENLKIPHRTKSLAPRAQERYDHHKKQAIHHLEQLKKQINTNPVGGVTWGHTGSMEELHHRLRELVNSGYVG